MNSVTKYLLVYFGCTMCVLAVCPNGCSSHGKCVGSVCVCFLDTETGETYTGNDCSEHVCPKSNPFGAVSSESVSSSGGVYSSGGNRALDVVEEDKKKVTVRNLAADVKAEIALVEKIENSLWKVKGLEVFTSIMPKSGGVLKCNFYTKDVEKTKEKDVDIRGFTDEYAYVKFSVDVKKIGDKDVSGRRLDAVAGEYDKVECIELVSMREDLVHYNPTAEITVTADNSGGDSGRRQLRNNRKLDNVVTMTWSNYGAILLDMGLLPTNGTITEGENEAKVERQIKKNDKFRFGCFVKTDITTTTPITIISDVTAIYDSTKNKDVVFTLTSSLAAATYVCYCLMDGDGNVIDITDTDLKDNIRDESNVYKFGKYPAETTGSITDIEENGHIVIKTDGIKSGTEITGAADYGKKEYLAENRVVYLTLLNKVDYTFKEEKVNMAASYKIPDITDYIIFPYIRTYPIDPSTELPTPIIAKTLSSTTPKFLYKVFYFAESIISGLNGEGGVIKCLNGKDTLLLNVKGVIKVDNNVMYSYIESTIEITDDVLKTLNCYGIDSKRKDLSIYNPSEVEVETADIPVKRILADKTITWSGYNEILPKLAAITSPTDLLFECYLPTDLTKEMVNLKITKIAESSGDITFTFTSTFTEAGKYMCYLLATADGNKVDIEKSHLFSLIRKDSKENKYYFGKYEVTTEVEIQKADDGSEVIPLDGSNNKIEASTSTIVIASIKDDVKDKIIDKLKVGNKFQLKLHKKDSIDYEMIHEITITEVTPGSVRLLSTALTIGYTPAIPDGFESDNVLYDAVPKKNIVVGNAIDRTSNLYLLSDFNTELVKSLKSIGGKLQCKVKKTTIDADVDPKTTVTEFISKVDVKGIIQDSGYYQFDFAIEETPSSRLLSANDHYYVDDIICNKILSERKDLTFWNPSTIKSDFVNKLIWTGYGEIASKIDLTFEDNKSKMACYNPSDDNKLITIYDVDVANNNDITFTFDKEKPSEKHICYLLADKDGKVLDIESSELSSLISKDNSGKYYYGEYVDKSNNNNNKDESNVVDKGGMKSVINVDGSITSTIDMSKVITPDSNDSDDDAEKLDLNQANEIDNPTILIPPTMIDTNIQKMITGGTILEITIHYKDGNIITTTVQILKAGRNANGKFSLVLSEGIAIETGGRLRLLAGSNIKKIIIKWLSEGSTHIALECSGQGSCDRSSGICKCYDGFSGSACQRLDCPNNCNGNGRCVPLSELLSNDDLKEYVAFGNKHEGEYKDNNGNDKVDFDNQVFGCLCDKRHRGYDCSLIECPSGEDPEKATNTAGGEYRDCSGRGICNYNTGICECFDGFSGEGCQTMAQMM